MVRYSAQPKRIPIRLIDRNPDNPRLGMHLETVESFIRRIEDAGGVYPPEAAARVRRLSNGRYQMIDGHHRLDGSEMAHLDHILAFVATMTDAEALEQVVLCNVQHPLTALELGLHVLKLEPAQGQAGQGLEAMARKLGVRPQRLRRYRHAARAFAEARPSLTSEEVAACRNRAEPLAEIATRAPRSQWLGLVRQCAVNHWTLKRARSVVSAAIAPAVPEPAAEVTVRKNGPKKGGTNGSSRMVSMRFRHEDVELAKRTASVHHLRYQTLIKKAFLKGWPELVRELESERRLAPTKARAAGRRRRE